MRLVLFRFYQLVPPVCWRFQVRVMTDTVPMLIIMLFLEENAPGVSFNLRINAGQPAVSVLNLFCKFIDYF